MPRQKFACNHDECPASHCLRGPAIETILCRWSFTDDYDYYSTQCGRGHTFIEGGPVDNYYVYCPYCGKRIVSQKV